MNEHVEERESFIRRLETERRETETAPQKKATPPTRRTAARRAATRDGGPVRAAAGTHRMNDHMDEKGAFIRQFWAK